MSAAAANIIPPLPPPLSPSSSVVDLIVEEIVSIAATKKKKLLPSTGVEEFELATTNSGANGMLLYEDSRSRQKHPQLQRLPNYNGSFSRVGTVGDGNCLLHAILFSLSPTYRRFNKAARSYIADQFREFLIDQIESLRALADVTYFEIGGAEALEENFEILLGKREEIHLEMAPLIAQLYGFNLLAVKLKPHSLSFRPVCVTFIAYKPELPTMIVNYIGGGLDFGNTNAFHEGGHYEAIFKPSFSSPSLIRLVIPNATNRIKTIKGKGGAGTTEGPLPLRRSTRTTAKATKNITPPSTDIIKINLEKSQFVFRHEEIADILAMFEKEACHTSPTHSPSPSLLDEITHKIEKINLTNKNRNKNTRV